MNIKEKENNILIKEANDPIENYLKNIIHRYFQIEKEASQESKEAIIIQAYTRLKEMLNSYTTHFIVCVNEKTGAIDLAIQDLGGEEAFEKHTAFNKNFSDIEASFSITLWDGTSETYNNYGKTTANYDGTNDVAIVMGNDDRMSDARTPIEHVHTIDDIEGLREAIDACMRTTEKIHGHANKDILDKISYTGSRIKIDLILIEQLETRVKEAIKGFEEIEDDFTSTIQHYLNQFLHILEPIRLKIQYIWDNIDDWIDNWLPESMRYTDIMDFALECRIKDECENLLSIEEYNQLKEIFEKAINLDSENLINVNLSFENPEIKTVPDDTFYYGLWQDINYPIKPGHTMVSLTGEQDIDVTIPIDTVNSKLENTLIKCYLEYDGIDENTGNQVTYTDELPHIYSIKNSLHDNVYVNYGITSDNKLKIFAKRLSYIPVYLYYPLYVNAYCKDKANNESAQQFLSIDRNDSSISAGTYTEPPSIVSSFSNSFSFGTSFFNITNGIFECNVTENQGYHSLQELKLDYDVEEKNDFIRYQESGTNRIHYYKVIKSDTPSYSFTWKDAREWCENNHGFLAMPKTKELADFVKSLAQDAGVNLWLGASDDPNEISGANEGNWKWLDGTSVVSPDICHSEGWGWENAQPDNAYSGTENYMEVYTSSGRWNDLRNDPHITENHNVDGFIFEKIIYRNPTTHKRYIVCPGYETWENAERICQSMGGHLAMPKTSDDTDFLKQIATNTNVGQLWIGMTDREQEGIWKWADGDYVSGGNGGKDNPGWASGEPNDSGGNENYGMIYSNNGLWNDYPNDPGSDHIAGFICELTFPVLIVERNIDGAGWQRCYLHSLDMEISRRPKYNENSSLLDVIKPNTPKITGRCIAETGTIVNGTETYEFKIDASDVPSRIKYRWGIYNDFDKTTAFVSSPEMELILYSDIKSIHFNTLFNKGDFTGNSQVVILNDTVSNDNRHRTVTLKRTVNLNVNNSFIFCDNTKEHMGTYDDIKTFLSKYSCNLAEINDQTKDYCKNIYLLNGYSDPWDNGRYHINNASNKYFDGTDNLVDMVDYVECYYGEFNYSTLQNLLPNAKIRYQVFNVPNKGDNS